MIPLERPRPAGLAGQRRRAAALRASRSGAERPRLAPPTWPTCAGSRYLRYALEVAAAGGHSLLIDRAARGRQVARRAPPALDPAPARPPRGARGRCGSRAPAAAPGELGSARGARSARRTTRSRPPGLVGGGIAPRAGEVTLAHRGVLFLDELWSSRATRSRRCGRRWRSGRVSIVRAAARGRLPCRFMLVAAANPCPCGRGEESGECDCQPASVRRYQRRSAARSPTGSTSRVSVERPTAEEIGVAEVRRPTSASGWSRRASARSAGSAPGAATPR